MTTTTRNALTATNLALHQHFNCDLYIHNTYHGSPSTPTSTAQNLSETTKALFKRGLDWESSLYSWLDRSRQLLTIPAVPIDAEIFKENILADDRSHFFVSGVNFWPPEHELNDKFREYTCEPLIFGLAKPDLIEIKRTGMDVQWRVIDAKSSSLVKTSHHIQIYFYTLCLRLILQIPGFQSLDSAAVWLPPTGNMARKGPSLSDIQAISISALAPSLDKLIFQDLPTIMTQPAERIDWHYNPSCHGCRYEVDCRSKAVRAGALGRMPNISFEDAGVLKDLLRAYRSSLGPAESTQRLTDIEDLHLIISNTTKLRAVAHSSPTLVKRVKAILALPADSSTGLQTFKGSPIIEAARSQAIQIIPRRNFTLPRQDDIAVIISVVKDHSASNTSTDYFYVTVSSQTPFSYAPIKCLASDIVVKLAKLIRSILLFQGENAKYTVQFYTWSFSEHEILEDRILHAALNGPASVNDVQLCITTLTQGASFLQTSFQPLLISRALITFVGKTQGDNLLYRACLQHLGLSTEGSTDILRRRINAEVTRLRSGSQREEHKTQFGQLPLVVILKKEVERQVALPIPGYWDLPQCISRLIPGYDRCPTDEEIFTAFKKHENHNVLAQLLANRNCAILSVLDNLRTRAITGSRESLLMNVGNPIDSRFIIICKEPHIRKLFYMTQFEVLAKLKDLWRSRMEGCPESPLLELYNVAHQDSNFKYTFRVLSGSIERPATEKDRGLFEYLLVPLNSAFDHDENTLPLEIFFDDLSVSDALFPLNQTSLLNWQQQHPRVQDDIMVADIRRVYKPQEGHSLVSLGIWRANNGKPLQRGVSYRLSPRFVDFNTTKVLSALFETDLSWESRGHCNYLTSHRNIPFLQLITNPRSFGMVSNGDQSVVLDQIQTELQELHLKGNIAAGALVLTPSQQRATQQILSRRLSVIWGPPGTGKTYTVALSLLRLLQFEYQHPVANRRVVFMTAVTHAAIDASRTKFQHLMDLYCSIQSVRREWLETIKVENVTRGSTHPSPSRGSHSVYVYTGTIYQLYNFAKNHGIKADCIIVDEAGQILLASLSLVMRSLNASGRVIVAGDPEQLGPILKIRYPKVNNGNALFGSVLDCLMTSDPASIAEVANITQLTENFRLNPDLGAFISTIYSHKFNAQKSQGHQLATALATVSVDRSVLPIISQSILSNVRKFLVALSDVIDGRPQEILNPPEVCYVEECNKAEPNQPNTLRHRPASLTLIRLANTHSVGHCVEYERWVHWEAMLAAALVYSLRRSSPDDDIFVATPHRLQREAVKSILSRIDFNGPLQSLNTAVGNMSIEDNVSRAKVTVDTIERLQGSEAPFVICLFSTLGLTFTDLTFLLERRRLNVAISRAMSLCILVASDGILSPPIKVLANEEAMKGYKFLKEYERRAWRQDFAVDMYNTVS